jgi:hypothetical protein
VILSASDSAGLETWLHQEHYNIPTGASEVLRPYVESGTKFFVARVDPSRVTFQNGRAVLSPLRFHYDTPEFSLPVRLGLLSSQGEQDLLVHILARGESGSGQRYEVANYANTFIPTNLRVRESVRDHFGAFYESVFRETVARNPRTVVTEYAWDAMSCDPCPGPTLTAADMMTLGADVTPSQETWGFTLTRLHYRYTRDTLGEDLVFRAAPAVVGGRGMPDMNGVMEQSVQPSSVNNFQGRYAMLHPWVGPVACETPARRLGRTARSRQLVRDAASARGGLDLRAHRRRRPPPALASAVEGALAWSPIPADLRGASVSSALVASQDLAATPATTPDTTPTPSTAPSTPSTAPSTPSTQTGAPVRANASAPPDDSGGCRASHGESALGAIGVLATLGLLVRRRRR